jgi:GAF domain-containing protein
MIDSILRYFKGPEDTDPSFIRLTRNILLFALFATLLSMIAVAIRSGPSARLIVSVLSIVSLLEIITLLFVLRGNIILAKAAIPIALVIAITIIAYGTHSIHDISTVAFPVIIIIASLLQGKRATVVTLPFALFAVLLLGTLDMLGLTSTIIASRTGIDDIVVMITLLITSSGILNLLIGRFNQAVERARANELAQIEANSKLKELQVTLEQRIVERTAELEEVNRRNEQRAQQFEAITLVGNAISSIRSLEELLPKITQLISEQFGYYHVGIFLNDASNTNAVLSAANSEGGKKMIQRGHRLKIGKQGIVGFTVSTGQPRIALDVGKDAVYFGNPELAETRSEMALPLKIGEIIVGALDVQSKLASAFTDDNTRVLTLLADQVSMAIENARLFDQTRRSLAESEALYRQYIRQAWKRLPKEQNLLGFRYNVRGASPIETRQQAKAESDSAGKRATYSSPSISVPLVIRGETIGTLSVLIPAETGINEDQMDLVHAIAERVALSAENARLFEETTRRAERERLVSDITVKIRSSNDPDAMINLALEELKLALGATKVELIPHTLQSSDTKQHVEIPTTRVRDTQNDKARKE